MAEFDRQQAFGQAYIYGHDATLNTPLGRVLPGGHSAKETDDAADVKLGYENWIGTSPFADLVCFLDITFAPFGEERGSRHVTTLTLSPDEDRYLAYRNLLNGFFQQGHSLAAHPVFQKGLPVFRERGTGRVEEPVDEESLRRIENSAKQTNAWDLIDERFLMWTAENYEIGGSAQGTTGQALPSRIDKLPFHVEIFKTFEQHPDRSSEVSGNVLENWLRFIEILKATRHVLRSHKSGDSSLAQEADHLGLVVAAPLGVRHPQRLGQFELIANVFFGLNNRANPQTALWFLRVVFLQVLHLNSVFRAGEITQKYVVGSIAHEVKRVTSMFAGRWAPAARDLFDVGIVKAINPSEPRKTIGELLLHDDYAFLQDSLLIVPFGDLLQAARRTIDFWVFSNGRYDLPLNSPNKPPADWDGVINFSWLAARDQVLMQLLLTNDASKAEEITERRQEIDQLRTLFAGQRPNVDLDDAARRCKFLWYGTDQTSVAQSFSIARVLMAWFANCIQHGSFRHPIDVSIHQASATRFVLKISNEIRARYEQLPDFAQAKYLRANFVFSGSTADIIRLALLGINGEIQYMGEDETNGKWSFHCEFAMETGNA